MKPFRFRLEKVLEWRRLELAREEAQFRQQTAALAAIDRSRAELEAGGIRAESEIRQMRGVAGSELCALDAYRLEVRRGQARLAEKRRECERLVAERQRALVEAQRRCRLLERLKERRLDEWKHELDHELQELGQESFLARWNRERS